MDLQQPKVSDCFSYESPDGIQPMKDDLVRSLANNFEGRAQQTDGGIEYCLPRDRQHLLDCTKWENVHQRRLIGKDGV